MLSHSASSTRQSVFSLMVSKLTPTEINEKIPREAACDGVIKDHVLCLSFLSEQRLYANGYQP